MNITVYLGANEGNDPCLRKAVEELGAWIGNSGNALVYGGSKGGLMGALADSVLKAGGDVTGVEPNFFIENEFQHDGLTKLIVTKDMSERKNKMIELGEAFIAFPGGTGTLEEIAEVMSKVSLKHLEAPCILYNLNGYYRALQALLEQMLAMDEGAAQLGELALIPHDSPISNLGILFYNTLFDENACCHVAVGRGFSEVIDGFLDMTDDQLRGIGINDSIEHVDFMIGSDDLTITGIRPDGTEVPVFVNGSWAE